MLKDAKRWLRDRKLPLVGFVLFFDGDPFGWERSSPDPSRVVPGAVALSLADGRSMIADGGTALRGAMQWICA